MSTKLLLLVMLVLPSAVQAQFTYTTNSGAITITGYTDIGYIVTIPSTINGLPVKSIGDMAFYNNQYLNSVTISSGVTSIGYGAFRFCPYLTSVTIPNTVTSIGWGAFMQSIKLGPSVTIPKSVTSIGDHVFETCLSLTSIYFEGDAPPFTYNLQWYVPATVYYLPGTTGWNSTYAGLPTVMEGAYITTQPSSLTVVPGMNAVFTVVASAFPQPASYQWRAYGVKSGVNLTNGGRYSGATSETLTITGVTTNDAINYSVLVTNSVGSDISQIASLTLSGLLIITQPTSLIVTQGNMASFTVNAAGTTPLVYQWRTNGVNLANGGRYSGATLSSLNITGALTNDDMNYSVVVTNSTGSITSQVATLRVVLPPSITQQPTSLIVTQGNTAIFKVAATGIPAPSYQWCANGVNLANGGRFSGVTSGTFTITGALTNDALNYSVIASNVAASISSMVATLTVVAPPGFTSGTNIVGKQGVALNFTNTANGSMPITFRSSVLPAGLSLTTTNGIISGSPTVFGMYAISVTASNSVGMATNLMQVAIVTSVPGITSVTNGSGRQGASFSYTITASNTPTWFGALNLPSGLSVNATNGSIMGTPTVFGSFTATISAGNQWGTNSQALVLTFIPGSPGITSALSVSGKQGQSFSYTITASNTPTSFSTSILPSGLTFASGVISGTPLVSGTFPITIGAANQWGSDSKTLTVTIASSVPVITSATTGSGSESSSYSYQITASDSPTAYGASGLPLGLTVNASSGLISGTPLYGGTFNAIIWAQNAWGVGSNTLTLNLNYAPITGLSIQDVECTYSSPYVLDFVFSVRDSTNVITSDAVVLPLTNFTANIFQSGVSLDPYVYTFLFDYGNKKQLRSMVVLDYSANMVKTNASQKTPFNVKSPQVLAMEAAAEGFINQLPTSALIGIYEFHGLPAPNMVQNFTMNQTVLNQDIAGIFTNSAYNIAYSAYVSKFWDALYMAINQFDTNTTDILDEDRYVVFISDGNDTSSTNNSTTVASAALARNVKLYCVGYGNIINTNVLVNLTSTTFGRAYFTTNTATLASEFGLIGKDIDGQYLLRWVTTEAIPFQPSFTLSSQGHVAAFNTNAEVNLVPIFDPTSAAVTGNTMNGVLRFVASASDGANSFNLRSVFAPVYVNHLRLHYRANWPYCTVTLRSVLPGEIMDGWSLTTTNDGSGGTWLDLDSSTNGAQLPLGALGDLLTFNMRDMTNVQTAFSFFDVDNTIYAGQMGQNFSVENASSFVTLYPITPYGTPVPWLLANGFTGDMAAAELSDPAGNGVPVWEDYYMGINPRDPNSLLAISNVTVPTTGQPAQITFTTAVNRTYQVQSSTSLGNWQILQDGIVGTGNPVTVTDSRNLNGVTTVFYRIAVY